MDKKEMIVRQLDRVFNGPAWHGPSIIETLDQITEAHAQNKFKDSHTLIQLIAHMATWRRFVIERLNGNAAFDVSEEQNFGAPASLQATIQQLKDTQQELVKAIENFPEERLKDKVDTRNYSFQTMLHGILHHDLYHLGQIGLLKR
jgi:uncharacterized damage-inducible protein DinB